VNKQHPKLNIIAARQARGHHVLVDLPKDWNTCELETAIMHGLESTRETLHAKLS